VVTYDHADAWDALGDATRRTIFELVAKEPLSVGEIADEVPVSRPAVSQHLKVLRRAGLVAHRQEGTRRYYSADPAGLAELQGYIERSWQQALASFKAMVEEKP
jgi:DNA-binding transcriptional ArsR family regulator